MALPPGPRIPEALQTVEWIVRPTALLRRCHERYGEPFTLAVGWTGAPMVLISDTDRHPAHVRRTRTSLRGGASRRRWSRSPGRARSCCSTGRAPAPAPADAAAVPRRDDARAGADSSPSSAEPSSTRGRRPPARAHPRMRALTLEVVLRVCSADRRPRAARRDPPPLDMTTSLPRLVAMSSCSGRRRPWQTFMRAVGARRAAVPADRRRGRRRVGARRAAVGAVRGRHAADRESCATSS